MKSAEKFHRLMQPRGRTLPSVFLILTTVVLTLAGIINPSLAWEFNINGEFTWNYYAAQQMGREGFFGIYDVDNSNQEAFNENFWAGGNKFLAGNSVYAGATATRQTQYAVFYPEWVINPAVRVRGCFRIGSFLGAGVANQVNSEYDNSFFPGKMVAFSPGYWSELWVTAQTPLGIVTFGKRPYTFGIGTFANGEDSSTTESLTLILPVGPLRFGLAFFPWTILTDVSAASRTTSLDFPILGTLFGAYEGSNSHMVDVTGFMTYYAGTLELGWLHQCITWSMGPETQIPGTPSVRKTFRDRFITRDFEVNGGIVFLKFFDGRFFFNAEFDYAYSTVRHRRNISETDYSGNIPYVTNQPGAGSVYQPNYTQMERYAVEFGALIGPAKATLVWAWIPGLDRRHGVLIDRQPNGLWIGTQNQPGAILPMHPQLANTGFFYPYSWLLVYNYGGGTNAFNTNREGQLLDANAFATRLDYAFAANLNVWVSILTAERLSHGYGWGYISLLADTARATPTQPGDYNNSCPAIPDNSLGYEMNAGLDWMLLQNLRFEARLAYWKPGKWWSYACRSRSNPGWTDPRPSNQWGTHTERDISGIVGVQIKFITQF